MCALMLGTAAAVDCDLLEWEWDLELELMDVLEDTEEAFGDAEADDSGGEGDGDGEVSPTSVVNWPDSARMR